MATQKASSKPMSRLDEAILEDIWEELWEDETIRTNDIHDISVDVENGQVCLSGHVSKDANQHHVEEIARSAPGVNAIHNHLVSDHDLSIQVAEALGDNERICPFILPVYSSHGWIELGGSVPNREIQLLAEATAASVPEVRGVILLPDIAGEPGALERVAVQPRIGVRVFEQVEQDETEGIVYQVVINPQNRLVTHAIVCVTHVIHDRLETCNYLVPVEAMNVVDEEGIFLNYTTPAINQFPVLNPTNYPIAPLTWQPPYPYAVGSVRWSRQQMKTEKRLFTK